MWRKQLVDNTRQLELGADKARQRTDMEMLDGIEVVRVVGASEAGPTGGCGWDVDRSKCRVSCRGRREVRVVNVSGKSRTQKNGWRAQG